MTASLDPRWFPVLVTGGAGFVGSGLIRRLIGGDEQARVHVLIRTPQVGRRLEDVAASCQVHRCDLGDRDVLMRLVAQIQPKTVVHLAVAGAHTRDAPFPELLRSNLIGTMNLLEAAVAARVSIFVNAGSSSEYGIRRDPMRESDREQPATPYALTKVAQTKMCAAVAAAHSLDAVTLRLFSVYGPREEETSLVSSVIRAVRRDEVLPMGNPDAVHDFVFLDDAVDAMLQPERFLGMRGTIVNLGTGIQRTNREMVDAIQQAMGSPVKVDWGARPARREDSPVWVADPTEARRALGWSARIPLMEGIRRTAAWVAVADSGATQYHGAGT